MPSARTGFEPRIHGFRFGNAFAFPLAIKLPLLPAVRLGRLLLGLCGGMCYAALDYWHASRPVPALQAPPLRGSRLHRYLVRRQLATMTPKALVHMGLWMVRRDPAVARLTAERELPKLRKRLDGGEPAVLLLVRAGGWSNPTHNHQVVATGYLLDQRLGNVTVSLYDPNYPHTPSDVRIAMSLPTATHPGALAQSTGEPLRGFFVLPYTPRRAGLPEDDA